MERFEFDPAAHDPSETSRFVESGCGAVTVGSGCLLPPLSSGGAQVPSPSLRFHALLIEPDVRISRIRLSDRTSRLHPRRAASKLCETYETEVPVQVREWISPAPATPRLVLAAQPPAQPHSGVVVECPIRGADGTYLKVVRPAAQRAVQLCHQLCGVLPRHRVARERMDLCDRAPDALLGRPHAQIGSAGRPLIHPPERVPQEVERPFRDRADSRLLLVDRQLQSPHELAHPDQRLLGVAPCAQDHEIIRIGHDARAEALLKAELLPSQYEPPHIEICRQRQTERVRGQSRSWQRSPCPLGNKTILELVPKWAFHRFAITTKPRCETATTGCVAHDSGDRATRLGLPQ